MIFNLKQTRTNFDMEYVAKDIKGKLLCIAQSPFQTNALNVYLEFFTSKYRMYFNNKDSSYGTSTRDKYKFKIFEDENLIGDIDMITIKANGFLQSYWCMELNVGSYRYTMYEVGFGRKGLFLCFYKDDKYLVAIAEKDRIVKNFKDNYTIYSTDEEHKEFIIMLLIQYDIANYGDIAEVAVYNKKSVNVNTISKELKAKYDPDFIPRIKAMHGID